MRPRSRILFHTLLAALILAAGPFGQASFEKPKSYPEGIPYVIVNGVPVIDGGGHTGARPGRALRGPGSTTRTPS